MAVYKRSYRSYQGPLTAGRWRFLVISRFALETLFQGRIMHLFLLVCLVAPLWAGFLIYFMNHLHLWPSLNESVRDRLPIDSQFFFVVTNVQGFFAFLLAAWAGPVLISPDLTNGALPLYLSRPLSRVEYVLGKMAVLFIPLSLITWIPGCLLYLEQALMAGGSWGIDNLRIAGAVFLGSLIWIAVLSLMALALSAYLKWRLVASAAMFAIFFCSAGFGEALNGILVTKAGHALNLGHVIGTIWMHLFDASTRNTIWREFFNVRPGSLELERAWTVLGLVVLACIWILNRKLRAREVVR
jgi:ABC-2 type transport system permease protein